MCVTSMIMDSKYDDWQRRYYVSPPAPSIPITPQEIDEFRRLLDRAREYDKKHGEPDCELEEKREKIRRLAKELGVDVAFV